SNLDSEVKRGFRSNERTQKTMRELTVNGERRPIPATWCRKVRQIRLPGLDTLFTSPGPGSPKIQFHPVYYTRALVSFLLSPGPGPSGYSFGLAGTVKP